MEKFSRGLLKFMFLLLLLVGLAYYPAIIGFIGLIFVLIVMYGDF